ncbi:MAG: TIM barrel protein [Streptosporangiales bacterium]|nr:TIM barrel protein [Streptosporangiales bacterium]
MKIAAAPSCWGVNACVADGADSAVRVLAEMHDQGFAATEAGPGGFLPGDPHAAADLLTRQGLTLVGGQTGIAFHSEAGSWVEPFARAAEWIADAGGELIVFSADTGRDDPLRPRLTPAEWVRLLDGLGLAEEVAAIHGLRTAFHPRIGSLVESPSEIGRVLDGAPVQLCLDTGHVLAGGGDPVAIAWNVPERIGHVHLEDVHLPTARRLRWGELDYATAVGSGLYRPLGHGDLDLRGVLGALESAEYDGWLVLSRDRAPADTTHAATETGTDLKLLRGLLSPR